MKYASMNWLIIFEIFTKYCLYPILFVGIDRLDENYDDAWNINEVCLNEFLV